MKQPTFFRNLLCWLFVVSVVAACIPSSKNTSVPPLDPNAISIYIAQTERAATVLTAAAAPPTATATLRSTFTPESTYTAVGPIIFPSATNISAKVQYFRVKHDTQLAIYNYRSRTAAPDWGYTNQTTEVVSMFIEPSVKSKTARTDLNSLWGAFIDKLNNFEERKLRYLKKNDTALFDKAGFPHMESKTMGGNLIVLDEITNGWGRVHTMDYKNPGDPDKINYLTRPDLIHKFEVVGWNKELKVTFWNNPPPGDIYWPLVADRPLWIPMDRLEAFPFLPKDVVASESQARRGEPSFDAPELNSMIQEGDVIKIVEYHPSGSDVWGRVGNGWIVLFTYEKAVPHYLTSWTMATLPPVPPVPESE